MARPARNNVDYFPFYCEEGKKMFYLEETYGNDGFATFVKLLRELARTDFHYLDLSKNTTMMFLAAKCKVSKEILQSIINDLVELEKFDAELWNENKIIWCQDFIDSISDAYAKRSGKCIDRNSLLLLLDSKGVRKLNKSSKKQGLCTEIHGDNPQIKEKDIKEDKTKEELVFPFNSKDFMDAWNILIKMDKWKKKSNAALKMNLNKLKKHSESVAIQMIENTIAGEYQGLFEIDAMQVKKEPPKVIIKPEWFDNYKRYLLECKNKNNEPISESDFNKMLEDWDKKRTWVNP